VKVNIERNILMKRIMINRRVVIVTLVLSCFSILIVQSVAVGQSKPEENKKPLVKQWKKQVVRQLSKDGKEKEIIAEGKILTETWNRVSVSPQLVYLPEIKKVMMLMSCDYDEMMFKRGNIDKSLLHHAMVLFSDDEGTTWSVPKYVHTDAKGKPAAGMALGLTYLGDGKLMLYTHEPHVRWFSDDYGKTWGNTVLIDPAPNKGRWMPWDPALVDRDPKTGKVVRIMETGYTGEASGTAEKLVTHSQAYVRFSNDEGRTWSKATRVPEWFGVDEVCPIRAKNGNIVATCRTDPIPENRKYHFDHFEGLGVSISKDNGHTWSKVKKLYDFGRHHANTLLMPNGDIVISYGVRLGSPNNADGYPQFGVEAVVSRDNGETWDMDNRYILATWAGKRKAPSSPGKFRRSGNWRYSPHTTSSILLPSGSILTAYGTGYRQSRKGFEPFYGPRDVGLVKWKINK